MLRLASYQILVAFTLLSPVSAAQDAAQRGQRYAQAHCAKCHAVGRTDDSRFKAAPPFRTLHQRYPVESLGEALAEGIVTGHPAMPEFKLEPEQIHDLLSYLKSLE